MTGNRRAPVVQITPARHSMTRKKAVGLTEEERQILLTELAEITVELDELNARTRQITARVHGAESAAPTPESGAA
ncbi:hypothetical protein BZB76_1052 [Actinomadura pelletieri DSM 43383]|uniref:Uncharacterized protein n=1 Tax=Actinomadura pelletieri DSM 43383 TaxID=1120940 RepID=A0A495QZU4_9ACTN|nr:hypothetical protein [Actinomadura pelletieri]RKS79578.1 hypothetical protein BZB76_1052 [Actinomadura pelletieri DSM 43383]